MGIGASILRCHDSQLPVMLCEETLNCYKDFDDGKLLNLPSTEQPLKSISVAL